MPAMLMSETSRMIFSPLAPSSIANAANAESAKWSV